MQRPVIEQLAMPAWYVLADDLTGAADCVAPLVDQTPIPVLLDDAPDPGGTIARCLPVRDHPPAAVSTAINGALAGRGDRRLMVKIDSAGRSPLDSILEALGDLRVVVCPALPSQGRTVEEGWVVVRGTRAVRLPRDVEVVNACSEHDLSSLADRVLGDPDLVPVVSSGFTRAIGPCHAVPPPSGRCKALVVVGTRHDVTGAQLELCRGVELVRSPVDERAGDQADVVAERAVDALTDQHAVVVTGGDTALALLRRLCAEAVLVGGELEPGVPVGWIRGGPRHGMAITMKSGGFGGRDTLARMEAWAKGASWIEQ